MRNSSTTEPDKALPVDTCAARRSCGCLDRARTKGCTRSSALLATQAGKPRCDQLTLVIDAVLGRTDQLGERPGKLDGNPANSPSSRSTMPRGLLSSWRRCDPPAVCREGNGPRSLEDRCAQLLDRPPLPRLLKRHKAYPFLQEQVVGKCGTRSYSEVADDLASVDVCPKKPVHAVERDSRVKACCASASAVAAVSIRLPWYCRPAGGNHEMSHVLAGAARERRGAGPTIS